MENSDWTRFGISLIIRKSVPQRVNANGSAVVTDEGSNKLRNRTSDTLPGPQTPGFQYVATRSSPRLIVDMNASMCDRIR